jgi:hypothetical protein
VLIAWTIVPIVKEYGFEREVDVGRSYKVTLKVSKKRDVEVLRYLVKHLNQGAGGQRAARTRRKKAAK